MGSGASALKRAEEKSKEHPSGQPRVFVPQRPFFPLPRPEAVRAVLNKKGISGRVLWPDLRECFKEVQPEIKEWDMVLCQLLMVGVAQAEQEGICVDVDEMLGWLEIGTSNDDDGKLNPFAPDYVAELEKAFPFQGYVPNTEVRAITVKQLRKILDFAEKNCRRWHDTTPPHISKTSGQTLDMSYLNLYHLNTWLILPATKSADCSMVELLTSAAQNPKNFVSHWWGEPIADFVACVESHMKLRGLSEDDAYWVCAHANRQHSLSGEVTKDPRQTSFYKAMALADGILLILDKKTETSGPATPFTRVWCAFEESVALSPASRKKAGKAPMLLDIGTCVGHCADRTVNVLIDGLTPHEQQLNKDKYDGAGDKAKVSRESSFALEIIKAGLVLNLEKAQASMECDRKHILNCIADQADLDGEPPANHPAYDIINRQLRGIFAIAAWRQGLERGLVEDLGLPRVLLDDVKRETLDMSFRGCVPFAGLNVKLLAEALPPGLCSLDLDVSECKGFGGCALDVLSASLPTSLRSFHLMAKHCWQVDDAGLLALGKNLPAELRSLRLNITGCKAVSSAGIAAIAKHLPNTLETLDLATQECSKICDSGFASLAAALPALPLTTLRLDLRKCSGLGDRGSYVLVSSLPPTLLELKLDCSFTGVKDAGKQALAHKLPKDLHTLALNMHQMSDETAATLAANLPQGLNVLHFASSQGTLTSQGVAALIARFPASLSRVEVELAHNQVDDAGVVALVDAIAPDAGGYFYTQAIKGYWYPVRTTPWPVVRSWADGVRGDVSRPTPAKPAANIPELESPELALPPENPSVGSEAALAEEAEREEAALALVADGPTRAAAEVPQYMWTEERDDGFKGFLFEIRGINLTKCFNLLFEGVHTGGHYFGCNELRICDAEQKKLEHLIIADSSQPKFQPEQWGSKPTHSSQGGVGGWWAPVQKEQGRTLELEIQDPSKVKFVGLAFFNPTATPTKLTLSIKPS